MGADHDGVIDCAIIGGLVHRGMDYPGMRGIYFYGDYCSARIWGLKFDGAEWQTSLLTERGVNMSSFGKDQDGNLLVVSYFGGEIWLVTEVR